MEIHFEIENKCLLQCRHCSSFATGYGEKMHYTIDDMVMFLHMFSEDKYVFLTGGEPFIHPEFDEILSSLTSELQNVCVGAFTAGIIEQQGKLCALSAERARTLALQGLSMCYFSLYSAREEEHDWMTGIEGSFKLTLESAKRLMEQNVKGKINLVITKKNKNEIGDIIELADAIGCTEIRLLQLINHGRAQNCWSDIGISESEYRTCVQKTIDRYNKINITASGCTDLLPCRPFKDAEGCQAGSKLAYVTYEGDVFPCASAKNRENCIIGTLKEIDLLEKYFKQRNTVNKTALCKR